MARTAAPVILPPADHATLRSILKKGTHKSRNIPFGEVAQHLNNAVKPASNETRIQDFFRQVNLDYLLTAKLLMSLLPAQGKLRLCLGRTEWDFGQC